MPVSFTETTKLGEEGVWGFWWWLDTLPDNRKETQVEGTCPGVDRRGPEWRDEPGSYQHTCGVWNCEHGWGHARREKRVKRDGSQRLNSGATQFEVGQMRRSQQSSMKRNWNRRKTRTRGEKEEWQERRSDHLSGRSRRQLSDRPRTGNWPSHTARWRHWWLWRKMSRRGSGDKWRKCDDGQGQTGVTRSLFSGGEFFILPCFNVADVINKSSHKVLLNQ